MKKQTKIIVKISINQKMNQKQQQIQQQKLSQFELEAQYRLYQDMSYVFGVCLEYLALKQQGNLQELEAIYKNRTITQINISNSINVDDMFTSQSKNVESSFQQMKKNSIDIFIQVKQQLEQQYEEIKNDREIQSFFNHYLQQNLNINPCINQLQLEIVKTKTEFNEETMKKIIEAMNKSDQDLKNVNQKQIEQLKNPLSIKLIAMERYQNAQKNIKKALEAEINIVNILIDSIYEYYTSDREPNIFANILIYLEFLKISKDERHISQLENFAEQLDIHKQLFQQIKTYIKSEQENETIIKDIKQILISSQMNDKKQELNAFPKQYHQFITEIKNIFDILIDSIKKGINQITYPSQLHQFFISFYLKQVQLEQQYKSQIAQFCNNQDFSLIKLHFQEQLFESELFKLIRALKFKKDSQ